MCVCVCVCVCVCLRAEWWRIQGIFPADLTMAQTARDTAQIRPAASGSVLSYTATHTATRHNTAPLPKTTTTKRALSLSLSLSPSLPFLFSLSLCFSLILFRWLSFSLPPPLFLFPLPLPSPPPPPRPPLSLTSLSVLAVEKATRAAGEARSGRLATYHGVSDLLADSRVAGLTFCLLTPTHPFYLPTPVRPLRFSPPFDLTPSPPHSPPHHLILTTSFSPHSSRYCTVSSWSLARYP